MAFFSSREQKSMLIRFWASSAQALGEVDEVDGGPAGDDVVATVSWMGVSRYS
jgi:hypothetical protein